MKYKFRTNVWLTYTQHSQTCEVSASSTRTTLEALVNEGLAKRRKEAFNTIRGINYRVVYFIGRFNLGAVVNFISSMSHKVQYDFTVDEWLRVSEFAARCENHVSSPSMRATLISLTDKGIARVRKPDRVLEYYIPACNLERANEHVGADNVTRSCAVKDLSKADSVAKSMKFF